MDMVHGDMVHGDMVHGDMVHSFEFVVLIYGTFCKVLHMFLG